MNIASTIARILLGVFFLLAGLVPFVFPSPPPQPGLAGEVSHALFASHWMQFVGFAQFLIGLSFLTNRYVPVALIMLAAFLYNSFAFHIGTSPPLLILPIVGTALWLLVALRYRALFAPIFAAKPAAVSFCLSAFVAVTSVMILAGVPSRATAASNWTVIVGGETPDNSVYANGFFPQALTIHTGDTVTWQFAGFHNVSFLSGAAAPAFAVKDGNDYVANPQVFLPVGGSTYDGTGFLGSGVPPSEKPFSYALTFTKAGHYEYACTLHPGMTGVVNVTDGGITETPEAALARGKTEQAASLAAGTKAFQGLDPQSAGTHVIVPLIGDKQARFSLLRFTRDPLVVATGTTVTWTIEDPFEVHTVTFAGDRKLPEFFTPQPQPGGAPKLLIDSVALTPTQTTSYDGTGWVNSGLLGAPGAPGNPPSSFSLTFTKPGRYVYWCLVHDHEGQQGVVIVK